jgi:hypothetical protein
MAANNDSLLRMLNSQLWPYKLSKLGLDFKVCFSYLQKLNNEKRYRNLRLVLKIIPEYNKVI